MEFNYRATDHTPLLTPCTRPPPVPPGFSYFANQSIPGHKGKGLTDSYQLEGPNSAIEMSEFIQREMEKGKIREEIMNSVLKQIQKERFYEVIVDEIFRRRFMKADVGRELALRGSLPHEMVGRPLGESFASSLDGEVGMSSEFRREFGGLKTGLQMNAEPNILDDKPQLRHEKLKEEVVSTAQLLQDVNISALAQLQKGNQNTRAMKVNQDLVVPKKGGNDGENSVSEDISAVVQKVGPEAQREEEACVGAETFTENPTKTQQLDDYVQPSGTLIEGNQEHKKNSFTFWCDMCQVGQHSEKNMEIHRAGKKHHLVQKKQLFRFWCDVCQIGTDTQNGMEMHKAGMKHHLAHKKQLFRFWCDVCQIGTNTENAMERHKAGKKHLAQKKQLFRFWCDECQIGTDTENVMEKHKAGNKHLSRLQEINQDPGDESPNPVMLPLKEAEANSLDTKNSYKLLKNLSLSSGVCMKKDEAPVQRTKRTRGLEKNSFKFWCDICQLGVDSEEVLKNHRYGKKHQAQLQKCNSSTGGEKGELIPPQ